MAGEDERVFWTGERRWISSGVGMVFSRGAGRGLSGNGDEHQFCHMPGSVLDSRFWRALASVGYQSRSSLTAVHLSVSPLLPLLGCVCCETFYASNDGMMMMVDPTSTACVTSPDDSICAVFAVDSVF